MKNLTYAVALILYLAVSPVSAQTIDTDYVDQITLKRSGGGYLSAVIARDGEVFKAQVELGYGQNSKKTVLITDSNLVNALDALFKGKLEVGSRVNFCLGCMSGTWQSVEVMPGRKAVEGETYGMTNETEIQAIKEKNRFTIGAPVTTLNSNAPEFFSRLETHLRAIP